MSLLSSGSKHSQARNQQEDLGDIPPKMSVSFQQNMKYYIPEDRNSHMLRTSNLAQFSFHLGIIYVYCLFLTVKQNSL
jgi:hypothetical protein